MPSIPGAVQFFFFLCFFSEFLFSDFKVTDNVDFFTQFCFYFLHPWHIWHWFILLPNTTLKLDKLLHFRHFTFVLLYFLQRMKKFFWSFWNMMLSFFLFPFSTYLSSFTFLYRRLSSHCSFAALRFPEVTSFPSMLARN